MPVFSDTPVPGVTAVAVFSMLALANVSIFHAAVAPVSNTVFKLAAGLACATAVLLCATRFGARATVVLPPPPTPPNLGTCQYIAAVSLRVSASIVYCVPRHFYRP